MKLTISQKIFLCFAIVVITFSGVAYNTYQNIHFLKQLQDEGAVRAKDAAVAAYAERLGSDVYRVIADANINRNLEETKKNWNEKKTIALKEIENLKNISDTKEEKDNAENAGIALNEVINIFEKETFPLLSDSMAEVTAKQKELMAADEKTDKAIDRIIKPAAAIKDSLLKESDAADKKFDEISSAIISSLLVSFVSIIVFVIISLILLSGNIRNILGSILSETKKLTESATAGKLDVRADTEKINFEFRPILEGTNGLLDALIAPLNVAAEYIDRISKGDVPLKITEDYKGDFNEIKDNLNQCIDTINTLVKDTNALADAIVEGKLYTRADAAKHHGDFKKIVEGINNTIDSSVKLIDSVPAPLAIMNKDLEILYMNKAGAVLGKASGENLSKSKVKCYDFFKSGDCRNSNCAVLKAMQTGVEVTGETDAHPGSFNLDVSYTGVPIKNKEGIVVGAFEIVTDLTAIKKSQKTAQKIAEFQEIETRKIADALNKLAKGDLNINIEVDKVDNDTYEVQKKFMVIKSSIDEAANSMNEILSRVSVAVEQVNTGSRQVSDASQSLSQTATESASSLEEIGASMHEISAQARQNAENAAQANGLASNVRSSAMEGNHKMDDMQKAMTAINESAGNVAKIIKAIDEIAFQTNLLALNAAVEAARAGKHGKGFTVVAEEVRNLAQRSAKAAKETAEMIESSIKKADAGSKIADDTARSLVEIVAGVTKVTHLIGEIAAASKEQEQGVTQVNAGIAQVDQVTQQNTATAEEAAAASEELSSQAADLKGMLGRFRLKKAPGTVNAYISGATANESGGKGSGQNSGSRSSNLKSYPKQNAGKVKIAIGTGHRPSDIISLDDKKFGGF